MIKYFKHYMSEYIYADFLQSLAVVLFVVFFISVIAIVYLRPKNYYKKVSEAPLEDADSDFTQN